MKRLQKLQKRVIKNSNSKMITVDLLDNFIKNTIELKKSISLSEYFRTNDCKLQELNETKLTLSKFSYCLNNLLEIAALYDINAIDLIKLSENTIEVIEYEKANILKDGNE